MVNQILLICSSIIIYEFIKYSKFINIVKSNLKIYKKILKLFKFNKVSDFILVLILISVFVVFLVLMQKSQSGGMGSAFGGGMAESAFGSDTSNVLTRATIYTTIAFFIIALILYLMYQTNASDQEIGLDVESITPIVEASSTEESAESKAE